MTGLTIAERRTISYRLPSVLLLWAGAVVVGATTGFFSSLYPPLIGAIVAATIILPVLLYALSPRLRAYAEGIGHRRIALFHVWRVPAALMFFWYGANGELPPLFWILAGSGDLVAGAYAAHVATRPGNARRYFSFHLFGFADFVVAVGTGLTYTLLLDPRMAPIAVLPTALIPLFGVGISGASHLIAFDMLRRDAGLDPPRAAVAGTAG